MTTGVYKKGDKVVRYCKKCQKDTLQRHEGRRENDWRCLEHGSASPEGQKNKPSQRRKHGLKYLLRKHFSDNGKCVNPDCNNDVLENGGHFHHINPNEKIDEVMRMVENMCDEGNGKGYTPQQIWEEAKKCKLICYSCHIKEHSSPYSVEELEQIVEEHPEIHESYKPSSLEDLFE